MGSYTSGIVHGESFVSRIATFKLSGNLMHKNITMLMIVSLIAIRGSISYWKTFVIQKSNTDSRV